MSRVKTSPAVITILAFFLMALLIQALPARAATPGTDPVGNVATLTSRSTSLHVQLAHLAKKVRHGHRGPAVIRSIVHVNRGIVALNHSLASLTRAYLAVDAYDEASLNSFIAGTSAGVHVAKEVVKLDRRIHKRSAKKASRKVSKTVGTLAVLSATLRGQHPKPTSTTSAWSADTSASGHPASHMGDGSVGPPGSPPAPRSRRG